MLLIGLTGSIGMGKSATADMFRAEGVPVYDADATVHGLYQQGGAAVAPLGKLFPQAIKDGAVDRSALSKLVIGKPDQMKALEQIVHPLAGLEQLKFLLQQDGAGQSRVVLDIPLLFEGSAQDRMDQVVVVSAPYDVQRARVLERDDMSAEKFDAIHAKQMKDEDKRALADFIIETDKGFDHAREQVQAFLKQTEGLTGAKFDRAAVEQMAHGLEQMLAG